MAKTGSKHIKFITLNDNELILHAKQGEQNAFTILFERYYHGIIVHISDILHENDNFNSKEMSEEPQDICQETFNKAFTHISDYNEKYKFSTWLYNIAKNTTIDYIRRNKKNKENTIYSSEKGDISNLTTAVLETPEMHFIDEQEFEHTKEIINQLSETYRDVIYLYAVEGYGYEEIATRLNISLSTAKVRVNRAKNLLAKALTDSPLAQKRANKSKGANKSKTKKGEKDAK